MGIHISLMKDTIKSNDKVFLLVALSVCGMLGGVDVVAQFAFHSSPTSGIVSHPMLKQIQVYHIAWQQGSVKYL